MKANDLLFESDDEDEYEGLQDNNEYEDDDEEDEYEDLDDEDEYEDDYEEDRDFELVASMQLKEGILEMYTMPDDIVYQFNDDFVGEFGISKLIHSNIELFKSELKKAVDEAHIFLDTFLSPPFNLSCHKIAYLAHADPKLLEEKFGGEGSESKMTRIAKAVEMYRKTQAGDFSVDTIYDLVLHHYNFSESKNWIWL